MRFRFVLAVVVATSALPGSAMAVAPKVQFSYTGGEQSYLVPPGVVMAVLAVKGGDGGQFAEGGGHAGGVAALVPVTPGQKLFVEVGSAGAYNGGPAFGGGGAAGAPPPVVCMSNGTPCADVYASSGGGASDVRTCSILAASCSGGANSAATRLIVGGGGGGESGNGNAQSLICFPGGAAGANTFQYPPGNPSLGPVPMLTAAGIVYPGRSTTGGVPGVTPAGGGSDVAGTGGTDPGCSSGIDSLAGSSAVGPVGGNGGNASSLGPTDPTCSIPANTCQDAGPGGGGGGGYFGGGGGATGTDHQTGNCGHCGAAGDGQGGAGGSSFVSNLMMDPVDESGLLGAAPNGVVVVVPAIEIDAPAGGAVYSPGQVVKAAWACGYDSQTGLGLSAEPACTGTVANGAPINTSPGTHTFTVSGTDTSGGSGYPNGSHTVSATVTYTVKAATRSSRRSAAGLSFTVSVPKACVAPGGKLHVTLSKTGSSKSYAVSGYSYSIGHARPGKAHLGSLTVSLKHLAAGSHTLKLVVTLRAKGHHKPKSKTVTLTVPFSIC